MSSAYEANNEIVRGRLVTDRHDDEVASALEVTLEGITDECPGHFRFTIGEGVVRDGFRYRLQADDGRTIRLHVVGVQPSGPGSRDIVADGKIVDGVPGWE